VLLKHRIITIVLPHFPLRQVENKETTPAQIRTIIARPNAAGTGQVRPRHQRSYRTTLPLIKSEHAATARPTPKPPNVAPPTWVWMLPTMPRPKKRHKRSVRNTPSQPSQTQRHRTLLLQRGSGCCGCGHCRHRSGRNTLPTPIPDHAATSRIGTCCHATEHCSSKIPSWSQN